MPFPPLICVLIRLDLTFMQNTKKEFLQIHPKDNVLVALTSLEKGKQIVFNEQVILLTEDVAAKHKFSINHLSIGDEVFMYGVLVGKASKEILAGGLLTVHNLIHAAEGFELGERKLSWEKPDISKYGDKKFYGQIPNCKGVYATGKTLEECRDELEEILEEWLLFRISKNLEIPRMNGISLKVKEVS